MTLIDAQAYIGESIYLKGSFTKEMLFKRMKENNIDISVVTAMHPAIGQDYTSGNELIREAVNSFPDKFVGIYRVNPWYKDDELVKLRKALEDWARGIRIDPFHDSFGPISVEKGVVTLNPMVEGFFKIATEFDVPVVMPNGYSSFCTPETAVLLASIVPDVTLMTNLTYMAFLLDHLFLKLPNIRYLTAPLRGGSEGVDSLLSSTTKINLNKIVFSTEIPWGYPEFELKVIELTNLDEGAKKRVMGENIQRTMRF